MSALIAVVAMKKREGAVVFESVSGHERLEDAVFETQCLEHKGLIARVVSSDDGFGDLSTQWGKWYAYVLACAVPADLALLGREAMRLKMEKGISEGEQSSLFEEMADLAIWHPEDARTLWVRTEEGAGA